VTVLSALLSLFLSGHQTTATRYADTPTDEGGTPACKRRLSPETYRRLHPIRCAHRTLPCGTILRIWSPSTDRIATCAVLDRGPWGLKASRKHQATRWRVGQGNRRVNLLRLSKSNPGAFRGDLDLSPIPARQIGLTLKTGRMPVLYWPVR